MGSALMFFSFCCLGVSVWAVWHGLEKYAFALLMVALICGIVAIDHEVLSCITAH